MPATPAPDAASNDRSAAPLGVAIEATSLLGPRTGVGVMTAAIVSRLADDETLDLTGLLISWRGRGQLGGVLPPEVGTKTLPFPARLAHHLWSRFDLPTVGDFDVVHGPNFVVPPSPGAAELLTIHDFGPWHDPGLVTKHARAYPSLVERALKRGAHVHVVSAFVGAEAAELLGLADDRIHVVRNGFNPGPAGEPSHGRRIAGGPYVLALGTVEPRKGHPTLVAAMSEVWASGTDLTLVIAGAPGWGSEQLAAAIDEAGAGDKIRHLGYVSDADRADLLAGATCLAFPSRYEGFGLPPLEAMAQGCPVVTTRAGALPEVCGSAARYVDVGDASGLAEAIVAIASDQAEAERLEALGLERVTAFSWDSTAAEMADLYRLLGSS